MGDGLKRAHNAARASQGKPPRFKKVAKADAERKERKARAAAVEPINPDPLDLKSVIGWLAERQAVLIYRLENCERARAEGHCATLLYAPWHAEPDLVAWRMGDYAGLCRRSEGGYWLVYFGAPEPWTDGHHAMFDEVLKPHELYTNISYGPLAPAMMPTLGSTPFAKLHWVGFDGAQSDGLAPIADGVLDSKRQREKVYHTLPFMVGLVHELARKTSAMALAKEATPTK